MGDEEEFYGEAESANANGSAKPLRIVTKPTPQMSPTPQKAVGSSSPSAKIDVGSAISVKDRLAMFAKNDSLVKPLIARKPQLTKNPDSSSKNPSQTPSADKPPVVMNKPRYGRGVAGKAMPAIKQSDILTRKKSLKYAEKRESQLSDTPHPEDVLTNVDGVKFKKLPFVRKPSKPKKLASLDATDIPSIHYLDVATGVEKRIGAGSEGIRSMIKSMSEDEEEEEESLPPQLPQSAHPSAPSRPVEPALPARRLQLPPPTTPSPAALAEETYDEAGVEQNPDEGGEQVYEMCDEEHDSPSAKRSVTEQASSSSPESTKQQTKAEKEKEKKDKQKKDKSEKEKDKQRAREQKEQEALIKKHKITDDELISSHFVEAINSADGGKKMLSVKAKERVALIRKGGNNCPDGKWIVKNLNTQTVGLVDADNMTDLEEAPSLPNGSDADAGQEGEDIYEEISS